MRGLIGKILYAVLFIFVLPVLQWQWARLTAGRIGWPAPRAETLGLGLAGAGLLLIVWGMAALRIYGKGLPMNAFPPPLLVRSGPYRLFRHPIYWGYVALMLGASLFTGSASGFWLVTPLSTLAIVALVCGYEDIDLARRFPGLERSAWSDLPAREGGRLLLRERLAAVFWIGGLLAAVNYLPSLRPAPAGILADPWSLPEFAYRPVFHAAALGLVAALPFLINERGQLRRYVLAALLSLGGVLLIGLSWPAAGGRDAAVAAAVPVCLTMLAARHYGLRFPRFRFVWWLGFSGLLFFQLYASGAMLAQAAGGLAVYAVAGRYDAVWEGLRRGAERVANSWREWVFGPVRVINHGFYAGAAAFLGIFLAGVLAGRAYVWAIMLVGMIETVCAALWAQAVEGSDKLKRPFGFYGAIAGIPLSALIFYAAGVDVWRLLGVMAVLMPWVQAVGRLRCLVNGCCHGAPTADERIGIRCVHPRSRVCGLSELRDVPIHPTPLYSILWLVPTGFVLVAAWLNGADCALIGGLYLILTGIGRFVEEAYRGEVQTLILGGLRLYQWAAVATVAAGALLTCFETRPALVEPDFGWQIPAAALLGGIFVLFAMGVDFPNSNARFSRLV
ncbi:MAG: prolipoprotein diacylglyceryl transferase [Acidobacteria bacterium]|nr:prolipoprotein diacylglyceryl transferase [Acidobacteriota bacterium]